MHRQKIVELKLLGILPRERGRPTMSGHGEALEIKRGRQRAYALRSRTANT